MSKKNKHKIVKNIQTSKNTVNNTVISAIALTKAISLVTPESVYLVRFSLCGLRKCRGGVKFTLKTLHLR